MLSVACVSMALHIYVTLHIQIFASICAPFLLSYLAHLLSGEYDTGI